MAMRQINCCKLVNPHFAGVLTFIAVNYFIFTYLFIIQRKPQMQQLELAIFHVFFLMLLWSMGQAILSDPGRVPIYWGFFAQESQSKKRRYCLLCHSFKPERCHHCSTCQRCVLNMDHHCPWISNCVGFHNRKFFMLFLFYIIVTLTCCLIMEAPLLLTEIMRIADNQQLVSIATIIRSIGFLIQFAFLMVITSFFKFHVQLVLSNSSTLDNLQRQRNPNMGPNTYDVGKSQNFYQVFGNKFLLWPFPISSPSSANGVKWPKNS